MAKFRNGPPVTTMPDGQAMPVDVLVLLLLVIDADGKPLRAHLLQAEPAAAGEARRNRALTQMSVPRMVGGKPDFPTSCSPM